MSAQVLVLVIVLVTLFCCAIAAVWLNMQESINHDADDEE